MLGSDRSRGYCLEMICADFLAGANLEDGDPDILLHSLSQSFTAMQKENCERLAASCGLIELETTLASSRKHELVQLRDPSLP